MSSFQSKTTLNPSRLEHRTMTLAQSNSKLIYDGGDASMFIRIDSKLPKSQITSLKQSLLSSIKGDLKFIQVQNMKQLNQIDYKRELMSIVISSENPQNVKYINNFMSNQSHQKSFDVIFKCDAKESFNKLSKIENSRLKLVTMNWDDVEVTIQDIYNNYYKKFIQFKGESKVKNKYYDFSTKNIVLNVYYPVKFPDIIKYIEQLQKRGSKSFKSIHFIKYNNYTEIIKRDVIRNKTKKAMTKMLTQSHTQMQAHKPQQTAMKQISQINNIDKNLILSEDKDVKYLQQIIRDRSNYQIVVLNTEKQRQTFFRGFLKCYKDPSEENPIITCHRLILLVSQDEDSLIQYTQQLTQIDQTIGVATYSSMSNLTAELFLIGQNSNNYGLVICSQYDWRDYQDLIISKQIKNVKIVIISEDDNYDYETLVQATVSGQDQLCEYLQSVIEQRQEYYDPVRGIDGDKIHVYFNRKDKNLKMFIEQGILGRKRLQTHNYDAIEDLLGYIEQTLSVDGVLIVCTPENLNQITKKVKDEKNVKLIVYGDQKQAGYNAQVINYCENKETLMNFLLNIPVNDQTYQSMSDLMYNDIKSNYLPLVKQQQFDTKSLIPPFHNKPLVYIRLPNKLQDSDSMIFQQRMKKHLGVDLFVGIYERIQDIRNLTFMEQPLSFIIGTTNDMKWIDKFTQSQVNNRFEVLIYTQQPEKGRKLLKNEAVKLLTTRFEDIQNYILGRIEGYETALYGPMVEYQYGNFPVNQNNSVVVYYPTVAEKLKLQLLRNRQKSQFLSMAMLVPYQNLNQLKKSLSTYLKSTKILIYVNQIPQTGHQMAVESMLRQFMNQNFALISNRQQRSVASYCKYSSSRMKKCVEWIRNIPVSKPPKTRVSLSRSSKLGSIASPPQQHILKPIQILIDKKDPLLSDARDISMWNTGLSNVKYTLVSGNQQLLSLENKAVIDNSKKYVMLMSAENVNNHLSMFKNSCIKLIVQNNNSTQPNKHQNILYESSPSRINSFLVNPFRDKIQYSDDLYYKNLRILVNSSLISAQEKPSLSSQGLAIQTYSSQSQLLQNISRQKYDLICCKNGDSLNPNDHKVVLANTNSLAFEESIPYQFIGNEQEVRKYISILSFLKRSNLKQFHDKFRQQRMITVKGSLSNKVFQRNYTLVNRSSSEKADIILEQDSNGYSLRSRMNDHFVAPSEQHIEHLMRSIPNYNKNRLRDYKLNTKPCFLFENKNLLKQTQTSFSHLNNLKYQYFQNNNQLMKLLDYSKFSQSFVFTNNDSLNQINKSNCQVVLTDGNPSNCNLVTALSPTTIKRMINTLKIGPFLQSKVRPETLFMIPQEMNFGQLSFLGQNLQQSANGSFQIQTYSSPEQIANLPCTHLYIVIPEQLLNRVLNKLPSLNSCHSKSIILKVPYQTSQYKSIYQNKNVSFITDNETQICEFILTIDDENSYNISGKQFLLLPNYYQHLLDQSQQMQKNIKIYQNTHNLQQIISKLPDSLRKYVVVNKFINIPSNQNIRIFFEGSARIASSDSLSQLTPSRILKMIKVQEPPRKSIHNALSDIQFSYILNKPSSSKSIKDQKMEAPVTRQYHDTYYQNKKLFTDIKSTTLFKQKYIVELDPQPMIGFQNEYYSIRSTPQTIKQYIFQPINFPQKFTKHPYATIVPYKDENQLKLLIRKFSSNPYVKITIQRYTRFEQYQIPPVPANIRPSLVEYMQNQLNKPQKYNIPDFNSEYYPNQIFTDFNSQYKMVSTNNYNYQQTLQNYDQINQYTSSKIPSISNFNSSDSLRQKLSFNNSNKLLINSPTIYYKHPNHRFIPSHFTPDTITFKPYQSVEQLLINLSEQNFRPNTLIIEEDGDIPLIESKLNMINCYSFLRILRSDFNDFGSLPNSSTVLLETYKQQSIIQWILDHVSNTPSVLSHRSSRQRNSPSLIKKNSSDFSQLSTNIY